MKNEINNDKLLISLKEAATISGYSPDYIGQLIRDGKIFGKQVYYNIAWMTTAEAVLEYKKKGGKKNNKLTFAEILNNKKRKFIIELEIFKLFFKTFKFFLPILLTIIFCFLILSIYIFYQFNLNKIKSKQININPNADIINNKLTF